jgi:uncharacterized protein with von Willebrand factor type A (vWA) domain
LIIDTKFEELFVEFGHELRKSGQSIGTDDILAFCAAVSELNPTDLVDIYWSGRTTLVHKKEFIPTYTQKFREFFLDAEGLATDPRKKKIQATSIATATFDIPDVEEGTPGGGEEEMKMGFVSSTTEIFRNKSFNECTPEELARMRQVMHTFKISPPERITRRNQPSKNGNKISMRQISKEVMRNLGEIKRLVYVQRKRKLRPIVFILDVSGSMADYSRNLLQFAHAARKAHEKVEVFCFGTRLTRITKTLDRKSPDEAMRLAGDSVLDWDGGTRIGDSIETFLKKWGRNGTSRGSIVVICSDGLDRGDPRTLSEAMERLSRLSYRILWMNPHKGEQLIFKPSTMGMIVADPFIDEIVSGHNLRSLQEFSRSLANLR